jgi:septal ring factor EnvC (AmiA/AmiB activator)
MFHIGAVHIHVHLNSDTINERLSTIMASQDQHAADIAAVTAKVDKIGGETRTLLIKVAELTDALAAAGNTSVEVDAALQALKDQVAVVDDLVPDPAA